MKLKILIASPYFPPMINGPSLYIYNLAKELAKRGLYIVVHTIEFPEAQHLKLTNSDIEGVEVHRFRYVLDPRRSTHDQPISPSYVLESIRKSSFFDVVHVHDFPKISNDLLIIALKKLKPHIPVVLTPHGAGPPIPAHKLSSKLYWATHIPWKVLYLADHIIGISPLQGAIFAKILGYNKVSMIPTGIPQYMYVDKPRFIEDGKLKVLFIGRITQEKGVKELLHGIHEVRKVIGDKNIELRFIGPDYGYLKTAQKIINELKLNNIVKILGVVTEEEKVKNLDWCDVLVLPSYYEAFGVPILEAMARGKPVIATKTVGAISLIKHGVTGFLIEIGNWKAIARYLLYLYSNPELKYELGRRALKYSRQFSNEKMIEKHIELYQKLTYKY